MLRGIYLFDLATVCHCPAPAVDVLTLADFARYVQGLNDLRTRAQQGG